MSTRRAVTHAHAQPAGAGGPSGDSQLGGRRGRQGCPCPATRAPRAWAPAAHWPQVALVLASPSRVPSCGGPAPGIPSPRATCAHAPCLGSAFREGLGRQCLQTPAPLEKGRRARGGSCRCQRSHADASAWYLASAAQTGVCSLQPCHHGAQKRRTAGRAKPRGTVPVRLHAVTGRTEPGAARPGSLASGAPWWRLPLAPQPSRAATSRPGARTRVPREVLSLLCLPGDVVEVRVSGARVYATSASGIKCPVYASLVPPANKRRVSCGRSRTPHFI